MTRARLSGDLVTRGVGWGTVVDAEKEERPSWSPVEASPSRVRELLHS